MPSSSPRHPGAPKGNTNALKHGLYSPRFQEAELKDLKALSEPDLTEEIAMLRLVIRRLISRLDEVETLDQLMRYTTTLSLATTQLSRLIKTQRLLLGELDEIGQAIHQAACNLALQQDHDTPP